jgi:regulator of sigma E protease
VTGLFDILTAAVLFVLVLGGLVLWHELGHFLTARAARVRVLEFGVGFPPRARSLGRGGVGAADAAAYAQAREAALLETRNDEARHEAVLESPETPRGTEYTLNWLPIGGFVKLEDEDGQQGFDPRSFGKARLPVKLVILVAGVAMNLLLAFAIFTGVAWLAAPYIGVNVGEVQAGSPAEAAGIRVDDVLLEIDGVRWDMFDYKYASSTPSAELRARAGQTVPVVVDRDGTRIQLAVTLRSAADVAAGQPALGVTFTGGEILQEYTTNSFADAVRFGWNETLYWFGVIIQGLAGIVTSFVTNPTTPPEASGPVGIAGSLGSIFRDNGPVMLLYFAGALSANLALVNALPFPPLDGGRMLMLVLKAIPRFGSRITLRAEQTTYAVGFIALFAFLIWITVFDIARGVTGGGTP